MEHPKELPKELINLIINFRLRKLAIDPYIFAIEETSMFSIRWLDKNDYLPTKYTIKQAAKRGNIFILITLIRLHCEEKMFQKMKFIKLFNQIVPTLVKYRHNEIIKWWFRNERNNLDFQLVHYNAALVGNIEILSWFSDHGYKIHQSVYCGAIMSNNITIYKWLEKKDVPFDLKTSFITAIKAGNLYFMERLWTTDLLNRGLSINGIEFLSHASNNYECFKWLLDHGCLIHCENIGSVIGTGNLEILELIVQKECLELVMSSFSLFFIRAGSIHIQSLQWFFDHGGKFNNYHLLSAAKGQLENVKFIFEKISCDTSILEKEFCCNAIIYCKLDNLIWARENGFAWDYEMYLDHIKNLHQKYPNDQQILDMFNWILDNK